MSLSQREVHYYIDGQTYYEFSQKGKCEYDILLVEGYKGDLFHTFRHNIDYKLYKNGIRWLDDGDRPETPPSFIAGGVGIPFEISYYYEERPTSMLHRHIHPFLLDDGILMTVMNSIGEQMFRFLQIKNHIILKNLSLDEVLGDDVDHIATWFNVTRNSGESDVELRGRLQDYLTSYVSSGTIESVTAAIETYTGTAPTILELWKDVSYYNYNNDDYENQLSPDLWRTYLYQGGVPDGELTFQAYYYDFLFQLSTFFCILPFDVISEYGVSDIKRVLDEAKAGGVQAYLGWLVDETFEDSDDWDVILP